MSMQLLHYLSNALSKLVHYKNKIIIGDVGFYLLRPPLISTLDNASNRSDTATTNTAKKAKIIIGLARNNVHHDTACQHMALLTRELHHFEKCRVAESLFFEKYYQRHTKVATIHVATCPSAHVDTAVLSTKKLTKPEVLEDRAIKMTGRQ